MEKKIWGKKERLVETASTVVDLLTLESDSFCSWHYHDFKYNMFFVLEGIVEIKMEDRSETLGVYDSFVVEPKIKHQFIARSDARILEIMFTKPVLEQDIIRLMQGGKIINGKAYTEDQLNERGFNGNKESDYD